MCDLRNKTGTVAARLYGNLMKLIDTRKEYDIFRSDAEMYVAETEDDRILGIERRYGDKKLLALFNFSPEHARAVIDTARWQDLLEPDNEFWQGEGSRMEYWLEPYGFRWLMSEKE